jgi:hypothetical protein
VLCHTAPGDGRPFDMTLTFAGDRELPEVAGPGAITVSRNIIGDPQHGIGKWSDPQIRHAMTTRIRPDGTQLSRTMPCDWYAKLTPGDLDAIVAFLRTIPPIKTP